MRSNGLVIVAQLAIRAVSHPLVQRYRDAIILGALREDVWHIPIVDFIFEHRSFSHFGGGGPPGGLVPFLWPGPRRKADLFFDRGLDHVRRGKLAAGFVQLGRVSHLLTDMSCPVHTQRTVHQQDPFEWYVEGNERRLGELPVPHVADAARPSALIESMALASRRHRADATNTPLGRLLERWGLGRGVSAREAGEQARALIPLCVGHTAALLRLFARAVDQILAAPRSAAISRR